MADMIVCDNVCLDVEPTSHFQKESRVAPEKGIFDNRVLLRSSSFRQVRISGAEMPSAQNNSASYKCSYKSGIFWGGIPNPFHSFKSSLQNFTEFSQAKSVPRIS